MIIRGARGLGDAFYLRAVVKYFLDRGKQDITVMNNYPDIFKGLKVKIIKYGEGEPTLNIRYAGRFAEPTNFLQDSAILANISDILKLSASKQERDKWFNTDKKVVIIKSPCYNHAGKAHTRPLIPDIRVIQAIVSAFKSSCYFVLLGLRNDWNFELEGIDEDRSKCNSIPDILSMIDQADLVITQSSYFIPASEAHDTKCLIVMAQAGLESKEYFWKYVTPQNMITQSTSDYVVDSWKEEDILAKVKEMLK